MREVGAPFDVVLTTNSGYPLDLNLYQGIKGMVTGARIVKPGGTLILACECRDGVPANSPYDRLLRQGANAEAILELMNAPDFSWPEQWQIQMQALAQRQAKAYVYSSLPDAAVRAAHLEPCHDIAQLVQETIDRCGNATRIAVLPQGPLTVPYLA